MKIIFFLTIFKYKPTGIINLTINIINNLSKLKDIEILLLGNREFDSEVMKKLEFNSRMKIEIIEKMNLLNAGFYIKKIKEKDFLFAPAGVFPLFIPKKIKKILLIHDFVHKEFSKTSSKKINLVMNLLSSISIKNADIIWANSNYTLQQAKQYFDLKNKKVFYGASIDQKKFKNLNLELEIKNILKKKYEITKKTLLFVGTLEPRKNLKFLLTLMSKLKTEGFQLLVVGGKGWGKTYIKEVVEDLNLNEDVKFLGYISDEELVELYNIVDIYISTSLNEGFGLPQLEAMNCGCPVISPHNSAMIEVVENAGETIEGWNENLWIEAIKKVYDEKSSYSLKSLEKAKEYNWKKIIESFYNIL